MQAACPPAPARVCAVLRPVRAAGAGECGDRGRGHRDADGAPWGWGPTSIESAYKLPVRRNPHQTVAVVDAFSTPHLAAYLAVYRTHYGLPPCTTASGCLRIVNQHGQAAPLPRLRGAHRAGTWRPRWMSSMVSAACPHCKILLVEATAPTFADLAAAENTAARLGAQVISNSYGSRENGHARPTPRPTTTPGTRSWSPSGDFGFTRGEFPGQPGHRDRGRRHRAGPGAGTPEAGPSRCGTSRRWRLGQRLLGLRGQAVLAARPALPGPHRRRRLRRGLEHPDLRQGCRAAG